MLWLLDTYLDQITQSRRLLRIGAPEAMDGARGHRSSVEKGGVFINPDQSAPRPRADERAETVRLEHPRRGIAARPGHLIDDHCLRAVDLGERQAEGIPFPRHCAVAQRPFQQIDDVVGNLAPDYDPTGERFGAIVESLDNVGIADRKGDVLDECDAVLERWDERDRSEASMSGWREGGTSFFSARPVSPGGIALRARAGRTGRAAGEA